MISEQGLGDTLQYMRYIIHLKNQGFDIVFQLKLHSLIKASGIDENPLDQNKYFISEGPDSNVIFAEIFTIKIIQLFQNLIFIQQIN